MARYRGKYEDKRIPSVPEQPPVERSRRKRRKRGGGILTAVLLMVFAGMIAVSGWKLLEAKKEYRVGEDAYATLASTAVHQTVREPQAEQAVTELELQIEQTQPEASPVQPEPAETEQRVDFEMLTRANSQIVAWIQSDDLVINYPVLQGSDNDYYLTHLYDGTVNKNGSIFVDYRNPPGFADRNTFIYGHNMLNGAMFASLSQYGTAGYYEQHPELVLMTPEGSYSLQVFSGYVTPGNSDIYQLEFQDDEAFETYLEKIRLLSDFASAVSVTAQDRIVTLSTCTYDYEEARYVVHCKLVPMQ